MSNCLVASNPKVKLNWPLEFLKPNQVDKNRLDNAIMGILLHDIAHDRLDQPLDPGAKESP
jgi:hypothetical protein